MSGMTIVAAAALTAALTAGPAVGAAADVETDASSNCTQTTTNGSVSSGGGTTQQPTEEQLQRAAELIQQARELLTEVAGIGGDTRAAALDRQLRAHGITPALSSGWAQSAHDTSDVLLRSSDPGAERVAVALARAGYGPTPADLRGTGDQRPAGEGVEATPPTQGQVRLAPAPAAGGVIAPAYTAEPVASQTRTAEQVQRPRVSAMAALLRSETPTPARTIAPAADTEESGETSPDVDEESSSVPGESSSSTDDGGEQVCGESNSSVGDGSAWQDRVRDLTDELAAAAQSDPTAQKLIDELKAEGVAADQGKANSSEASPRGEGADENNVSRDRQVENNRTGVSSGSSSSGESEEPSDDNAASSDTGTSNTGTSGWEDQASSLVDKLSAAGADDPAAQALAEQLHSLGITGSRVGGDASDQGNDDRDTNSADQADAEPASTPVSGDAAAWEKLSECESGGDWEINTGNGYQGGLQFDRATWLAYDGDQYAPTADQATKEQQIEIARKVRDDRGGYSAWPACSKKLNLPR
ncbi:transglycosylase family protein [Pseudonocardia sp. H11422]|uniref:transglycosylase family protein n=1 Tax=Pseudonocardia sp. H11422 TaxID=2835866 RepID=UPI0020282ABD|nr:transglycosylase family protein [Pseudonocardia sp. H11422]